MFFEYGQQRPEHFKEDWEGQFSIIPWMSYLTSIPHPVYMVTTLNPDGKANAGLLGWSAFNGAGDDYCVLMPTYRGGHTHRNIQRDGEFCINFVTEDYVQQIKKSIAINQEGVDEIEGSGFSKEPSHVIKAPRIKESYLRLECKLEWERDLYEGSNLVVVCAKAVHISVDSDYATRQMDDRYEDSILLHMMPMIDPRNGERIQGGIGRAKPTQKINL